MQNWGGFDPGAGMICRAVPKSDAAGGSDSTSVNENSTSSDSTGGSSNKEEQDKLLMNVAKGTATDEEWQQLDEPSELYRPHLLDNDTSVRAAPERRSGATTAAANLLEAL